MIPAEDAQREANSAADRRSYQRRQARVRDGVSAPAAHRARTVKLQCSHGRVPDTPGAACAGQGLELWFSDSRVDIARAKAICEGCPDRLPCLSGAIERRETYGIWGGTDFNREHHQEDVA